jgi:hypothetical protein
MSFKIYKKNVALCILFNATKKNNKIECKIVSIQIVKAQNCILDEA